MTTLEINMSSLDDLSQLDSQISSNSSSGELGSGGGSGSGGARKKKLPTVSEHEGKPKETAVVSSKETTRKSEEPKGTTTGKESSKDGSRSDGEEGTPVFRRRSLAMSSSETKKWKTKETTKTSDTIQSSTVNISSPGNQKAGSQSLLSESAPSRVKKPVSEVDFPPSEPDTPVSFLSEQQRSTNTTPSINVMSEDDMGDMEGEGGGEGEGDRWWSDRMSPMSGNTSPCKADTLSDSEGMYIHASVYNTTCA